MIQSPQVSDSRTAIVVGVGPGLGWALARRFAMASGANILAPSWGTNGTKISPFLGQPKGLPGNTQLKVTMTLAASADHSKAPTTRRTIRC